MKITLTNENKPYLIGMILISLLIIGAVYVLMTMMSESINSDLENVKINKENEKYEETIIENNSSFEDKELNEETKTTQQCLAELGYDEFIFLHSPYCGHCRTMIPIVEELIAQGYKIQIVNAIEDSNFAKISNCIPLTNFVPQFICNKNSKREVGPLSKSKLIEMYNSC